MYSLAFLSTALSMCLGYYGFKNKERILKKIGSKYIENRSNYMWYGRSNMSDRYIMPRVKKYLDKFFNVDCKWIKLNSSNNLVDRVLIENAFITSHENVYLGVTDLIRALWNDNCFNGSIKLDIRDVFESFGYIQDRWRLNVTYKSHSNPKKKIEAKRFKVVYDIHVGEGLELNFPPYSITESVKIGFGAHKFKSIESDVEGVKLEDARMYAGLRCNFYNDCEYKEVVKMYMEEDATVKSNKGSYVVGPLV